MLKRGRLFLFILAILEYSASDGQEIIRISMLDLDSFTATIQGQQDETKVVTFWASWCVPCLEELPYFNRLKQDAPAVKIILVNLDFEKDVSTKVLPLIQSKFKSCEHVRINGLSADDWMPRVDPDWTGAIPATLIVNGQNKLFKEGKFKNYEELNSSIKNINKL